ncbi:hypothetical protein [Asticcacaulis solisilvae]|uniref:hypothetical protein n=1 Tax=Asticcacaulis solisilvae TaxID=1217274 RepID=UPI003FD6E2A1
MSGNKGKSGTTPRDRSSLAATRRELKLTRRTIMGWLLAAGGTAGEAMAQAGKVTAGNADLGKVQVQGGPLTAASAADKLRFGLGDVEAFTLLRPRDLLLLTVHLKNMKVTGSGAGRRIVITDPSHPAYMLVEHQPQAIAERTWPDDAGLASIVNNGDRAETYMAGTTRLAYRAPSGFTSILCTADEVLKACMTWRLNLSPRAVDAVGPGLDSLETIRQRLDIIAEQQKADLHAFDPHVEPALRRAAAVVAEAMLKAVQQKIVLPTTKIDALIKYEIMASLTPEKLPNYNIGRPRTPAQSGFPSKSGVQKLGANASDPWMGAYVERAALQQVVHQVAPPPAAQARPVAQVNPSVAKSAAPSAVQAGKPAPGIAQQAPDNKAPLGLPPMTFVKTSGTIEDDATDIEAPVRLHVTPLSTAGFTHATGVVDHGGRIAELWHTSLGGRASDWTVGDMAQPIRALYSEDEDQPTIPGDQWAMMAPDRQDLVKLMRVKTGYKGLPAVANHMRLTALGASMDILGNWPDPLSAGANVSQWKHVSSTGRDQFVRIVKEGYLFPFGHAAALIKVSERKFSRQSGGGRVAALMTKYFIIVRDRVRTYPGPGQMYDGRDFPFASVEILTKQTPDLHAPVAIDKLKAQNWYPPVNSKSKDIDPTEGFWPSLSLGDAANSVGDVFRFQIAAVDTAGNRAAIDMPLIFVLGTVNADATRIAPLSTYYNDQAPADWKGASVNGTLVRFSRDIDASGNAVGGESDYPARHLNFKSWAWDGTPRMPHFYPGLVDADIDVPSLKKLLGKPASPKVTYHDTFLNTGFNSANPAQVVFKFASSIGLGDVTTDKFGGLAAPKLNFDGLSRKVGVLNGYADYLKPSLSPEDVFKGAKLLGVVSLSDIISLAGVSDPGVPKLTTVDQGDKIVTSYTIQKDSVSSAGPFIALTPHTTPQFSIVSTVTISKTGGTPDTRVEATLNNFKINLFGFIILNFDSLSLTVKPGSKTDVNPTLNPDDGVRFGGPLEFINSLRDYIPMDGFSDPPGLDVTASGITASYSLGLPTISVGVMSLQNINLGAGFDLPFTGDGPSARFNFAERHNPFNLTISLFGGGGFFALGVDTGGVRELEASLEFGAQISIDLGVASGGVYVKGGFYFHWQETPSKLVQFEGYVEMGGHLSVLGLITVSLVFHLGLTYEKTDAHSRLYGTATLTVEIDILFFSISQDITVERQFAGSDADPAFIEYTPASDEKKTKSDVWDAYCAAFA